MQTIEQLRQDTPPLTQLGTVCDVTGEPLGTLLTRLADKDTPLFVERPQEDHLYCVPQKEVGEYQEIIVVSTPKHMPHVPRIIKTDIAPVEANHFRYLVLSSQDYSHLLDGDIALSVKLFSQAAFRESDVTDVSLVDASQYIKERLPNAHFHQRIKAKFACYSEERPNNEKTADTLKMKRMQANAEDLLVSRTALFDILAPEDKPDEPYPAELTGHLQPWKSDVLKALNKTAYDLFSHMRRSEKNNSKVKPDEIKFCIEKHSPTIISLNASLLATLLRPEHDQAKAKHHLKSKDINHYPHYFSEKLIYLNELSKTYHDEYAFENSHEHKIEHICGKLAEDNIIPKNTATRIGSVIRPIYEQIIRPKK